MVRPYAHVWAVFAFASLTASQSYATALAGPFVNPATGHSYTMLAASSWTDAETEALTLNGHLVTVNDLAENNWLVTTFKPFAPSSTASLLIGFTDSAVEGTFVWTSGAPVTFTNWASGEPNNNFSGTGEDYTNLLLQPVNQILTGQWNDITNSSSSLPNYGVVEVVPEPASATALLATGGLLLRRREYRSRLV
jgi:hypothetical protein